MTEVNELSAIINDVENMLGGIFDQMEWAEDEIKKAIRRHPSEKDALYHSFTLLKSTHDLMGTEFVFRAHCRELLDRVAAGEDTRPGTAAEVCCISHDVSLATPMTTPATGLYMRMWEIAFPDKKVFDETEHYEAIEGQAIDDLEALTRRKLSVQDRKLGDIECAGMHHGENVQCKYIPQALTDAA
jgi:hypothetical protein